METNVKKQNNSRTLKASRLMYENSSSSVTGSGLVTTSAAILLAISELELNLKKRKPKIC